MVQKNIDDITRLLSLDFDLLAEELGHTPDEARRVIDSTIQNQTRINMLLSGENASSNVNNIPHDAIILQKILDFLKNQEEDSAYYKLGFKIEETKNINITLDEPDVAGGDWPAVFFAVYREDVEFLDLLLEAKPDLTIQDHRGYNVLMELITTLSSYKEIELKFVLDTIKKLAKSGVDMNQRDNDGKTVLDIEFPRYQKNNGDVENIYKLLKLYTESLGGFTRKQIFTQKVVDELKLSRLTELKDFAELIVKTGDINVSNPAGETLLHFLLLEKKFDIIENVLEAGADLSPYFVGQIPQEYPIHNIIDVRSDDNKNVYKKLIEKHEKTLKFETAISVLKNYGENSAARWISDSLDIDVRDENGFTPLMYMIIHDKHNNIITALKNAGANTLAIDEDGNLPLMHAVMSRKEELVDIILDIGGSYAAEKKNFMGYTAQELAISLGLENIAQKISDYLSSQSDEILF